MSTVTQMMRLRQTALDAASKAPVSTRPPFSGFRVDVCDHPLVAGQTGPVPDSLTRAVVARLVRQGDPGGPGVAIVSGLTRLFDIEQGRAFHEVLFHAVWAAFRRHARPSAEESSFRIKTGIIADGAIPLEFYGSSWSFKPLHIDRDALLFSHLYGPVDGFTGGAMLLVDAALYMGLGSLGFSDVFEWSQEPTEGSKPVLRSLHTEAALAQCGVNIGSIGPDEILFVNNLPDAGVLHGATPVVVTDPAAFRREYHRCSVKDLTLC
jgi:hypothetical protein